MTTTTAEARLKVLEPRLRHTSYCYVSNGPDRYVSHCNPSECGLTADVDALLEAARAEATADTLDVERLREALREAAFAAHALHRLHVGHASECGQEQCARWWALLAPAQPAPAGGTCGHDETDHGLASGCIRCGCPRWPCPATPRAGSDVEARMRAALDDATLAAIAERAEAATPGPWHGCAHVNGTDLECPCRYPGDIWDGTEERVIAFLGYDPKPDPALSPPTVSQSDLEQGYANGRLIAHARTDIPLLLAEVARLRRELGALQGG